MNVTNALDLQIQFFAEKRNESYIWYGEVSITGENWTPPHKTGFVGTPRIWSQEANGSRAPLVSRMAGA